MRLALVLAFGVIVSARTPAQSTPAHDAAGLMAHDAVGGVVGQAAGPNADTLFTAALSRAKNDRKTLFLWFSAPG